MGRKQHNKSKGAKGSKGSKKKGKQQLSTAEDFLAHGLDSSSDEDENLGPTPSKNRKEVASSQNKLQVEKQQKKTSSGSDAAKHKQSLEKLKERDPEFYEFLKGEDKSLLNFEASESEEDEERNQESVDEEADDELNESDLREKKDQEASGSSDDFGGDSDEEVYHRPPAKLEVASDDEMDEDEEEDSEDDIKEKKKTKKKVKDNRKLVTMKMLNAWSSSLRENNSLLAFHNSIAAFKAAVHQVGKSDESGKFKVEGSTVFNAVVRLCITDLLPTLSRVLNLPKPKDGKKPPMPSSSDKWKKIKLDLKSYLTDLLELLDTMGEATVLNVLLKHVTQLVPYYSCFPQLARLLTKKLIIHWSSADETSRVLAFLSINRLTRTLQDSMLELVIKQMYMAYVKNCKFTSPSTLPMINFMQRSLVEIFAIDVGLTYQYAFVYIRQLAIHLRNAITVKKKETCQAVYNWQYVHSLYLWGKMLSQLSPNEMLEPLIYPLTQVVIGTIKLIPTARYYPLRFHCVRVLNILAEATNTYIPVLPFLTEVFEMTDFNKKHKHNSFKPFNFACILKFSNTQLEEKVFRDGVVDQLYEHLMDHLHIYAHSIGFPELVLPPLLQMKKFMKQCKVANYTKQIKQIVDKVEETSRVITQRRKSATLSLTDNRAVNAWEARSKQEGTPIGKYYTTWRKLRDRELQHEIAGKERVSTDDVPVIERRKGPTKATEKERVEFDALFDASSDESDDESRFMLKEERPVKKRKTQHGSDSEDYSDFDEKDIEQLAMSASEEEEDDDDEDDEDDADDDDSDDVDDEDEEEEEDEDDEIPDVDDIVEDFKFSDDEDD